MPKQKKLFFCQVQVKDELMSRRGDHKGGWDEFIDHTVTGIDAWINGGKRRVICWGFMVFQKPVRMLYIAC